MALISEQEINLVRSKADIAEVIGRYIPLVKKGKGLTAVCPFHDDHNPSLSISVDKQIYKCFVCGAGGNVFTFVQNYEKISFVDAVAKVADYYHIQLSVNPQDVLLERYDDKTKHYFKILNEAIAFQQYQLKSALAQDILIYLNKRGYDQSVIDMFKIGYNPDKNALSAFLQAKGYLDKDLVTLNLSRLDNDQLVDVFSDRITFPIYDRYGSPIAFTARTYHQGFEPKYINSSETDLYVKGNILYNYHNALTSGRKQGKLFLVEGVTDVIALYRAGYDNVVATLGTALSKQQIQLIKQVTKNVVLCYDGDKAGQAANFKNGKLLNEARLNVFVVSNLNGKDPDDIIRDKGKEHLQSLLNENITWIEFVMDYLLIDIDINNYTQKKNYATKVITEINQLQDNFDKDTFIKKLALITEFESDLLKSLLSNSSLKANVTKTRDPINIKRSNLNGRMRAEYEILSQMINSVTACDYFIEHIGFLPTDENNQLAMMILEYARKYESIKVADILSYIEEDNMRSLVLNLDQWDFLPGYYNEKALADANLKLQLSIIEDQIENLKKQQKLKADANSKKKLLQEILELKKDKIRLQDSFNKEEV